MQPGNINNVGRLAVSEGMAFLRTINECARYSVLLIIQ